MADPASYAVVTGSRRGIGAAIAAELAARGYNLVLVSRPHARLQAQAAETAAAHGVDVRVIQEDLLSPGAADRIIAYVDQNGLNVSVLVNNAGGGYVGPVAEVDHERLESVYRLNTESLTVLTKRLLPALLKAKNAYILNVGSVAGIRPMPYKTVYSAAKAYVHFWTYSLREELRNTGVSVTLLCPGPVFTNPGVRHRIAQSGRMGARAAMEPADVARAAVSGMLKGRRTVVPGFRAKAARLLVLAVPERAQVRIYARMLRSHRDME